MIEEYDFLLKKSVDELVVEEEYVVEVVVRHKVQLVHYCNYADWITHRQENNLDGACCVQTSSRCKDPKYMYMYTLNPDQSC